MRKGIGSADYWMRVALLREISAQKHAGRAEAELRRIYSGTVKDIDEEIRKIFNRYGKDLDLTREEAERLINAGISDKISLRLRELLARTKDPQQRNELMKRIHAQAYGARISRLEAVKQNIYLYFTEKGIREIEATRPVYNTIVEESYYRTVHDIAKGCDVGINFSLIPKRAIDEIVAAPWYGVQFSRRVWNNVNDTAEKAQEIIERGLMGHKSYVKMAQELQAVEQTSYYNASRLVRTQANYFLNQAEAKVYDELGFEEYKYLATLDERTCEKCSPLDNKIFKMSEKVEGVNFPTIHPHCRCTTTVPTGYARRWARDPLTGKGYKVGDMSYDEWISSMTDEQREAFEKRVKDVKIFYRRNSDREQYDRYVKVLGAENMPKTFDKFVGVKYNDDKAKYEDIKHLYREVNWQVKAQENYTKGSMHSAPFEAQPNSVLDNYSKDGTILQRRYYGRTGKPRLDIDMTDHGNPKEHTVVPHYHNWTQKDKNSEQLERDSKHDNPLEKWHIIANKDILGKEDKQ